MSCVRFVFLQVLFHFFGERRASVAARRDLALSRLHDLLHVNGQARATKGKQSAVADAAKAHTAMQYINAHMSPSFAPNLFFSTNRQACHEKNGKQCSARKSLLLFF
ncbi:hypothetical protein TW95_gp1746 [Pandoravirus inopinatum]|uniref:Uncharacterized protein n=1 Tax=Pandoravirus inopinatum TaxID=1605721 RepID=A0A0B5J934_9VIRU|nr:hypothetical protein TW95_gp1746 [Pandoravirus inopinatum]AJF98480.1 hypothetical protein [Pandoravirus inopinatum]